MLGFTREERRVTLFLIAIALIGVGINFSLKVNSRITRIIKVGEEITKIDINLASEEDLILNRIVSAKLAKNIIAYRNSHGPFRTPEELKEVKGIGNYRLKKLKEIFFVE